MHVRRTRVPSRSRARCPATQGDTRLRLAVWARALLLHVPRHCPLCRGRPLPSPTRGPVQGRVACLSGPALRVRDLGVPKGTAPHVGSGSARVRAACSRPVSAVFSGGGAVAAGPSWCGPPAGVRAGLGLRWWPPSPSGQANARVPYGETRLDFHLTLPAGVSGTGGPP